MQVFSKGQTSRSGWRTLSSCRPPQTRAAHKLLFQRDMTIAEKAKRCLFLLFRVLKQGDADVAVLHAGDEPYLVGPRGNRRLAHTLLSAAGMRGLVRQLLPHEERDALARIGATHFELPVVPGLPHEHFAVDANLNEHGPVVNVRRFRVNEGDAVPPEMFSDGATPGASSLRPATTIRRSE
jgi:hypothetical protein